METIKINELVETSTLSSDFLFVTQSQTGEQVTYKLQLSTLWDWIKNHNFDIDLSKLIAKNAISIEKNVSTNEAVFKFAPPSFAAGTQYFKGDFIIDNLKFYRCIKDHTSTTEIELDKWEKIGGGYGYENSDLPIATQFDLGTIKVDGKTLKIDEFGTCSAKIDINADSAIIIVDVPASNWGSTKPYIQSVSIPGLKESHCSFIDIYIGENNDDITQLLENYNCISKADSLDGELKLQCNTSKPKIDLRLKVKISGDVNSTTFVSKQEFEELKNLIGTMNNLLEERIYGGI